MVKNIIKVIGLILFDLVIRFLDYEKIDLRLRLTLTDLYSRELLHKPYII